MANTHNLVIPIKSSLLTNKFNQVYLLGGQSGLNTFQIDVVNQFSGGLPSLFKDFGEMIGSVRWYPFSLQFLMNLTTPTLIPSSDSPISLGGTELSNARGMKIFEGTLSDNPNQSFFVLIGKMKIARKYNNFLDYKSEIKLWIPYFDYVQLNPTDVMGQWIFVYFSLDIYSGKMTYYILKDTTSTISSDAVLIDSAETIIGDDIPITLSNNVSWGIQQAITSVSASMSPKGLLGSASALMNNKQHTKYAIYSNTLINRMRTPQQCFVEIKHVIPMSTYGNSSFKKLYGLPSDSINILSDFENHGFVKVDECHLEGQQFATATTTEVDEIEQLLKDGVIL